MESTNKAEELAKDLNYWKANAEENYISTPLSVLKYITELEKSSQSQQYNSAAYNEVIEDLKRENKQLQEACDYKDRLYNDLDDVFKQLQEKLDSGEDTHLRHVLFTRILSLTQQIEYLKSKL